MNRSTKKYISMKLTEYKICKKDIIDMLKTELNDMTFNLHELFDEYESKKEKILFLTNLKYNPKRKINKGV